MQIYLGRVFVLAWTPGDWRDDRDPENSGDPGRRRRRLQLAYIGRYKEALEEEQAALDADIRVVRPMLSSPSPTLYRAEQSEAEAVLAQARKLNPNLSIKWMRARLDEPEITFDGLRKAGLPGRSNRRAGGRRPRAPGSLPKRAP